MFDFHFSDPVVLVNAVSMNLTFRSWLLPSKPVFVEEMELEVLLQSVSACCGKRLMFNFHLSDPVVLVNAINAVSMNLTFRSWSLPSKPVFVEEMEFKGALAECLCMLWQKAYVQFSFA